MWLFCCCSFLVSIWPAAPALNRCSPQGSAECTYSLLLLLLLLLYLLLLLLLSRHFCVFPCAATAAAAALLSCIFAAAADAGAAGRCRGLKRSAHRWVFTAVASAVAAAASSRKLRCSTTSSCTVLPNSAAYQPGLRAADSSTPWRNSVPARSYGVLAVRSTNGVSGSSSSWGKASRMQAANRGLAHTTYRV